MIPQYVLVRDDHQGLETVGSGTWEVLAKAYRNRDAPPSSPSGHGHHYGVILCAFPAEVQLTGLGALSDALVCRQQYTSVHMCMERDIMLGPEHDAFVTHRRAQAVTAVLTAFQYVKKAEMLTYGRKSVFHWRENGQDGPMVAAESDSYSQALIYFPTTPIRNSSSLLIFPSKTCLAVSKSTL